MGLLGDAYDGIAGVADHAAGSVDESIGRQFDDEEGGGFADYDTWAGVGDHLAGSVDESIGRQFDDEEGGGAADEAANAIWTGTAGLGDWLAGDLDETVGGAADDAGEAASNLAAITSLAIPAAGVAVLVAVASAADEGGNDGGR